MEKLGLIFAILFCLIFISGVACIIISLIVDKEFVPINKPQSSIMKKKTKPNLNFDFDYSTVIIPSDNNDDNSSITI